MLLFWKREENIDALFFFSITFFTKGEKISFTFFLEIDLIIILKIIFIAIF